MTGVWCIRSDVPESLCRRRHSVRVALDRQFEPASSDDQALYILEFKLDHSGFVYLQLEKDSAGKGVLLVRDGAKQELKEVVRHRQSVCLNDEFQSWTGTITASGGTKCVAIACTRLEFYFTLFSLDQDTDLQAMVSPA